MEIHLEDATKQLYELFDLFNKEYYDSKLICPVLSIMSNGTSTSTMGWYAYGGVWKDHKKEVELNEIVVAAEFLYRDFGEVCSTLLHEMVHLYCDQNGIDDTSRNGRYHNKKFKEVAEKHGLKISYDKSIGFSPSELNESSKELVSTIERQIHFTRLVHSADFDSGMTIGEPPVPKKKRNLYKCPCGNSIRSTKELNLICGECMEPYEVVGGK